MDESLEQAHRQFSARCFNACWELVENPARTAEQDEEMRRLAEASLWHWTQRPDCTGENLQIGYWLLARAHAISGRPAEGLAYADRSLALAVEESLKPFYVAYAHEARARALVAMGDAAGAREALQAARALLPGVVSEGARRQLEGDLNAIPGVSA